MQKISEMHEYRQHPARAAAFSPSWLYNLTEIIEGRYHDEDSIQKLLKLIADSTGLTNVSIALPDAQCRFKAQYCSTGVTDGVYSFAVQHALCRQFESREWLVIKEDRDRAERFDPYRDTVNSQHRCLLVPLVLRQAVLAVLVLNLRDAQGDNIDLRLISFLGSQIAHMLGTQVVPNFKTLHARPYQRVQADELSDINSTIDKCSGNKTMAARLLGLTPRQLRYRLAKLTDTAEAC